MKKFMRSKHKTMGALPYGLRMLIGDKDIAAATAEFNEYMTALAVDFHTALACDTPKEQIHLVGPKLFGHDVTFEYVASGSIGSVYKMQIAGMSFAFKINRNGSHGELAVMPIQKRARNLINKMHIGSVFAFNNRKYSWVLSDYIEQDAVNSFYNAMERLFFMYVSKGLDINDAHPGNFKNGKLIDVPSLWVRKGKIDDIQQLTRFEQDIVKKLLHHIKTDDIASFSAVINMCAQTNPAVIKYLFFAMKHGRPAMFCAGKTNDFARKLSRFESVVNDAYKAVFHANTINNNQR